MTNATHSPRKLLLVLAIIITAVLLASCSQAMLAPSEGEGITARSESEGAVSAPSFEEAAYDFNQEQPDIERLVIKNADLSIVVDDPAASLDRVGRMADEMGGFIVSANLSHEQLESGIEVPVAVITIRVPAEKLNEALEQIRQESDQEPVYENIGSQDVTREYTDLQSRLRNLESAEAQLQNIMDSATKTEDVLAVYNELVQVREQIEVIKGEIQYYEQSSALSAITVNFIANEAFQPLTIGGWQPGGVAKQAIQALISAFKSIVNAAIWIALFILPTLALIGIVFVLPAYLLWRVWRRRRAARADLQQATPPNVADQTPE
jgi:hypothetical protein